MGLGEIERTRGHAAAAASRRRVGGGGGGVDLGAAQEAGSRWLADRFATAVANAAAAAAAMEVGDGDGGRRRRWREVGGGDVVSAGPRDWCRRR